MSMPDVREVYEMVTDQKPSEPGALERQHARQVRTARNRKISALAMVAMVFAVTAAVILASLGPAPRSVGTTPTPMEVARRFVDSLGSARGDEALSYLAERADVSRFVASIGSTELGGPPGLRLAVSYLSAVGYEQTDPSCVETSTGPSGASIHCEFDIHLLRSDEIGVGPFGPAALDIRVVDGRIVDVSELSFDELEAFSPQVWEPFASWVTSRYPEYAAAMYADDAHASPRLTQRTIWLWERLTRDWAAGISS